MFLAFLGTIKLKEEESQEKERNIGIDKNKERYYFKVTFFYLF